MVSCRRDGVGFGIGPCDLALVELLLCDIARHLLPHKCHCQNQGQSMPHSYLWYSYTCSIPRPLFCDVLSLLHNCYSTSYLFSCILSLFFALPQRIFPLS